MSERTDRKLQQVPLASYNYRHEAEFAAGFLTDAGIPYRLQIEDPTLGLSTTNSATLWVAAMDERRARQVIEHEAAPADQEDGSWADETPSTGARPATDRPVAGRGPSPVAEIRGGAGKPLSDLTIRQRSLSLVGAIAASSLLGLEAVRSASMAVAAVVVVVAVALILVAVTGRAPAPLRAVLESLSGEAP